jgi:hypothetical protein
MAKTFKAKPPAALPDIPHVYRVRLARLFCSLLPEENGCVLWPRHRDRKGYGQVRLGERAHWAHRVFYAFFKGPIPEGMTIHHTCANSGCVNPEHLELATVEDNTREGNSRRGLPAKPDDDIPF